tara:strand:- start:9441 stop:9695 length:255 start_codon:yes stop_codon:yes gene_type:complete
MVVVSHRGWDGSRILGIFNDIDSAKLATKDFIYDPDREELIFDIMKVGKISKSACHTMQGRSGIVERKHQYDFPSGMDHRGNDT